LEKATTSMIWRNNEEEENLQASFMIKPLLHEEENHRHTVSLGVKCTLH
jgi:hypothetical protein